MSDGLLVRHCAPTMANIKTGSLFCGSFSSEREMISDIRHLNLRLKNKGIRVLPMNYKDGRGLIYVYRPKRLINDLQDCEACRILRSFGYSCSDENACLRRLICRIKQEGDFPHEIGLFLGYPPEDVDGFINHKGECKFCGHWKVYGDVESAKCCFAKYRKCTDLYCRQWQKGKDIEHLTVAV